MTDTQTLDKTIIESTVTTVLDDGTRLSETVELTLRDFSMSSIQALAYWEEIDPVAYNNFRSGDLKADDLSKSAVRLRGLLFSVIKSKVKDRRIRGGLNVGDFDVSVEELSAIVGAVEDLNVDLDG